jgi:hypothetical protein
LIINFDDAENRQAAGRGQGVEVVIALLMRTNAKDSLLEE